MMKLAVRALGLCVVLAGFAAASVSSSTASSFGSHQATTARLPIPVCGKHVPTCTQDNLSR
jgi:hypothetical protein